MLIPTLWGEEAEYHSETLPQDVDCQVVRCFAFPVKAREQALGAIEQAVQEWISTLSTSLLESLEVSTSDLVLKSVKRWSIYRPMLLLPSGSLESKSWITLLQAISQHEKDVLWHSILHQVSRTAGEGPLTHLAINSGIPLSANFSAQDNILRTPSGLIMLHGNFGPALHPSHIPTAADFNAAFWVRTKQNGIYQTWAPRYTMFSRGNIKEKSRILDFHSSTTALTPARKQATDFSNSAAVDLYAGIGYFVFSYCAMGIGRVWCWEINPWSVEGLRRGAALNNWKVRVVKGEELLFSAWELSLDADERIVVFEESNEEAYERLDELKCTQVSRDLPWGEARHVNCGLLPTSELSWKTALETLDSEKDGWLHLHENIALADVEARKVEIEMMLGEWVKESNRPARVVLVEHVEQVKTFAPGVWHCVFDVYIS